MTVMMRIIRRGKPKWVHGIMLDLMQRQVQDDVAKEADASEANVRFFIDGVSI